MVKCDLCAAGEYEGRFRGFLRLCTDQREQSHARIPEAAVREYLCVISTEDNGVEAGVIAVPAFFQEEGVCLASTSSSTIDDDISRIGKLKEFLLLWLRTNNHGIAPFRLCYRLLLHILCENAVLICVFFLTYRFLSHEVRKYATHACVFLIQQLLCYFLVAPSGIEPASADYEPAALTY